LRLDAGWLHCKGEGSRELVLSILCFFTFKHTFSGGFAMQASVQPVNQSEALIQELEEYRLQFLAVIDDAKGLLSNLSNEQFNWSSQPGIWSVAQCLDHLNATGKSYGITIDKKIAEARSQQRFSKGPFHRSWLDKFFVGVIEPPVKLKVKAPKQFAPQADKPMEMVVAEFMLQQEQFIKRLQNANGLDLTRLKVASPVTKLLRMTLLGVFGLVLAHERRHLWQAHQILQQANFPQPTREAG
jgi:hypothetical protein